MDKHRILNHSGSIRFMLDEVGYALDELTRYYNGTGILTDKRAAEIFRYFAKQKMAKLKRMAEEIDAEYGEEIPRPVAAE